MEGDEDAYLPNCQTVAVFKDRFIIKCSLTKMNLIAEFFKYGPIPAFSSLIFVLFLFQLYKLKNA